MDHPHHCIGDPVTSLLLAEAVLEERFRLGKVSGAEFIAVLREIRAALESIRSPRLMTLHTAREFRPC